MMLLRILAGLCGTAIVVGVVLSALRTVVLPRGEPVRLTSLLFNCIRVLFDAALRLLRTFESRDRLMSHYAPISLLLLPLLWLTLAWLGFTAVFWAVEQVSVVDALVTSGSSLLTLGYERPEGLASILLSFAEAALAMSVLALLLVTYLPSMYAAFSEREEQIALFEVSAGTPPSAVEMMIRYHRISGLAETEQIWVEWERWFAKLAESHTNLPALVFFRSPDPRQSWVTSAGAVLDAAAMVAAVIDLEQVEMEERALARAEDRLHMPRAETCIRAGFLALRRIADFFDVDHDPDPAPGDPISITRAQFDDACAQMIAAGVPLRADLDQCWQDWAGWRVNYDTVLGALADLTIAPPAPWITRESRMRPADTKSTK